MIEEYLSKSWDAYKRNFWEIIAATLIVLLIVGGIMVLAAIPLFGTIFLAAASAASSESADFNLAANIIPSFSIFFIGMIIAAIAGTALGAGLVRVYADALKGKAQIGALFSTAREKFWSILGANILKGLILLPLAAVLVLLPLFMFFAASFSSTVSSSMMGSPYDNVFQPFAAGIGIMLWLLLGFIAFFLIALLFTLVDWAVVLGGLGAAESVKKSYAVVKENYLELLALSAILAVISFVVSFVPVVGGLINFFVVSPITLLAYTAFYMEKTRMAKEPAAKKRKTRAKKAA